MAIFADIWAVFGTTETIEGLTHNQYRLPIEIDENVHEWTMDQWHDAIQKARKQLDLQSDTYHLEMTWKPQESPATVIYRVVDGVVQEPELALTSEQVAYRLRREISRRREMPRDADGVGPDLYGPGADVIRIVE